MIERGIAVAALVLPIGFLDFPIMDQRIMRMPAGRESVSEGEFGLLQGRERVFEERALLHLPYLLSHCAIGGIGVLGGFDGELDCTKPAAAAQAAMSLTSAYRIESDPRLPSQKALPRSRRRPDPLIEIFDPEVVPMLQAPPGLRPIAIFVEMQRRHPQLPDWVRRTLANTCDHGHSSHKCIRSSVEVRIASSPDS